MSKQVESHVVTLERTIRVGSGYTLVPSEAYPGIDRGNVKVYNICGYEDLDISDQGIAAEWLLSMDVEGTPDLQEVIAECHNGLWVRYDYTDRKTDYTEVMPISVFAYHAVPRY